MFGLVRSQLIAASVIVLLALLGTLALVFRAGLHKDIASSRDIKIIEPGPSLTVAAASTSTNDSKGELPKIRVHVTGRVRSPGVYSLKVGSRVEDAVDAAGGALANADRQSINLAQRLNDGDQVVIAEKGVIPPPTKSSVNNRTASSRSSNRSHGETRRAPGPQKLKSPSEGKVNINNASLEELQRLPGIGPSIAQRIVDYRTQNGKFKSVDQLQEVSGIGEKKLAKVRPFASL